MMRSQPNYSDVLVYFVVVVVDIVAGAAHRAGPDSKLILCGFFCEFV